TQSSRSIKLWQTSFNDAFARKTCAARSLGSSLLSNWSAEGAPSVPGLASFRPNHFIGLYERELELAAAACAAPAPAAPRAARPRPLPALALRRGRKRKKRPNLRRRSRSTEHFS